MRKIYARNLHILRMHFLHIFGMDFRHISFQFCAGISSYFLHISFIFPSYFFTFLRISAYSLPILHMDFFTFPSYFACLASHEPRKPGS